MIPLSRPIVLAPMAGGPSTPELCAAVSNAGGLGTLAAGYLTPDSLQQAITRVENLTERDYGINIFSPPSHTELSDKKAAEWSRYRELLARACASGNQPPTAPECTDDHYDEKLRIAINSGARVISFTFGYPSPEVIKQLHNNGKRVVLTATTPEEIAHLADTECDAICVQGNEAGGHRGTVLSSPEAGIAYSTSDLLNAALAESDKPIIAAGGVSTSNTALQYLRIGAVAVQVGTRFLLADEAGTKQTHRDALIRLRGRRTRLTTAFTGKLARAIDNTFVDRYSADAPSLYPELHYLTAGLRKTADTDGDVESLNLWAGEGYEHARPGPAIDIINELLPYSSIAAKAPSTPGVVDAVIVGGGPRGLAAAERVMSRLSRAGEKSGRKPRIAWYEDSVHGSGRVWTPYQTTTLLMNTVASQLSGFPDASAGIDDDYLSGPGFYEWLHSPEGTAFLAADTELSREAKRVGPNTYTSRALYGAYLHWVAQNVTAYYSGQVDIHTCASRMLGVTDNGHAYELIDTNRDALVADNIILATGHTPQLPSREEHLLTNVAERVNLKYIPRRDASPRVTARISARDTVLLRGMGLTFFDYLALFTENRGGRFVEEEGALHYVASGREPKIVACSRKGAPHHGRGRNQKQPDERWEPRFLTEGYAETLSQSSFAAEVWPTIVLEAELAFTLALLRNHGLSDRRQEAEAHARIGLNALKEWRRNAGLKDELDWPALTSPLWTNAPGQTLRDYQRTVCTRLDQDVRDSEQGNVTGPLKAALDVLRDLRNEIRACVQYGRISGASYYQELAERYSPNNAFLSIGPPLERIKQLRALVAAGIVTVLPANPVIGVSDADSAYTWFCPSLPEPPGKADVLIEARLPLGGMHHSADPLLTSAHKAGLLRPHVYDGTDIVSGAIDADPRTFVVRNGRKKTRGLFVYGIPLEGLQWGTAATIRPHVNSVIISDADTIAKQIEENYYGKWSKQ